MKSINPRISFAFIGSAAICFLPHAEATPPAWWSVGDSPVIDESRPANNHGIVNIGQAKWMAKRALDSIRLTHPGLATLIESDLVGSGKPIENWDPPGDLIAKSSQRAPLLIGQLKAISAPFYNHLNQFAPDWLEAERILNGTQSHGSFFPWTTTPEDDENKAVANVGQLKAVFSLRFETMPSDDDSDGVPNDYDADPNDSAIGKLTVSIEKPLSGTTIK